MQSFLPKRLKELRKEHNMTQEQLAKKINKTRSTIAGYETERKEPDFDTLVTLASIFNISTDYLLGLTDSKERYSTSDTIIIPVVSETLNHQNILVKENICGYSALLSNETGEGNHFYFKVKDNSMCNSRILAGDLVLIKMQDNPEDGRIFLVSLENKEAVLRRIFSKGSTYIFQPDNPVYSPYIVSGKEEFNQKVRIIGKAVHVRFSI